MPGSSAHKTGRDGNDVIIEVPVGTVVKRVCPKDPSDPPQETEVPVTYETVVDFVENGQEWVACKGGRGGKGNAHFVTSTHQAPKFAQPGEDGQTSKSF